MKFSAIFVFVLLAICMVTGQTSTELPTVPTSTTQPTTTIPTTTTENPELLEEALALLDDVRYQVNNSILKLTDQLNEFGANLTAQYALLQVPLAEKIKQVTSYDEQYERCYQNATNDNINITTCAQLKDQVYDNEVKIQAKWNVCKYNYIDQFDYHLNEVIAEIKSVTKILDTIKTEIDNCKSNECLESVILEIAHQRIVILKNIDTLYNDFIANQDNTLLNAYNCIFDGSLTFINEVHSVVIIYCDCVETARFIDPISPTTLPTSTPN